MTKQQVFQLHENPKYQGLKGKITEKSVILGREEITATSDKRGESMSNETDLLKLKLENLEQQFEDKLNSRDKLFEAKFENLSLEINNNKDTIMGKIETLTAHINGQHEILKKDIELITDERIKALENSLTAKNKENRNFTWMVMGVAVALATLIATIAIPLIQAFIS